MALVTNISVTAGWNDGVKLSPGVSTSYTRTASGDKAVAQIQDITTGSWQALNFGLLSTLDVVVLLNTDPTNYVQIALDNAGANLVCRLQAGQVIPIPMDPGVTGFYAKANGNTVRLEVLAVNQ